MERSDFTTYPMNCPPNIEQWVWDITFAKPRIVRQSRRAPWAVVFGRERTIGFGFPTFRAACEYLAGFLKRGKIWE